MRLTSIEILPFTLPGSRFSVRVQVRFAVLGSSSSSRSGVQREFDGPGRRLVQAAPACNLEQCCARRAIEVRDIRAGASRSAAVMTLMVSASPR